MRQRVAHAYAPETAVKAMLHGNPEHVQQAYSETRSRNGRRLPVEWSSAETQVWASLSCGMEYGSGRGPLFVRACDIPRRTELLLTVRR